MRDARDYIYTRDVQYYLYGVFIETFDHSQLSFYHRPDYQYGLKQKS
jgi:hypothetical protein